jgi:Holliday junction resolvase-like predicted endonuclease
LRLSGFRVVATNWHCRVGELDIVALSPKTLLFAEVKTRVRRGEQSPAEAVTFAKRARIIGSADAFVHRYPALAHGRCLEFSIVEVVMRPFPRIRHLRDAFRPEECVRKY